jgi:hypothetical protein
MTASAMTLLNAEVVTNIDMNAKKLISKGDPDDKMYTRKNVLYS